MSEELHLLSPRGFVASGIYAGIKMRQVPDIGLLFAAEGPATAAACFTTNKVFAAPVKIGREHVAAGKLRGVVLNSGNANACTGRQGERDARRMCDLAAAVIKCRSKEILPSSTGIIGHLLPMDKVERGIVEAGQNLGNSREHALLFSDAIMTTDTRRKFAGVTFKVGRERVTLAGICKGAGMIGPRMSTGGARHATMLAYLTTDAAVAAPLLKRLIQQAADSSFNSVTIDDHTSTNDTAVLLASGASGAKVGSPAHVKAFAAALDEVCQSLAYQIASDGEGATKVVTVTVRQAKTLADARRMARAIANSPLVKCAMNGNDPNWGRIVSGAGLCGAAFNPDRSTLTLQGTVVYRNGTPLPFDAAAVSDSLKAPEVKVDLACRLGKHDATVWTCDLSKDYVTINADYHT
jgi:glutamate N-acetyltransferase/amino-acid N-acetyltransferase